MPEQTASPAERSALAAALALLVHVLFLGLMVFALRWQTTPSPVVAEVWDALPGLETPPTPKTAPEPDPAIEPPPPEPPAPEPKTTREPPRPKVAEPPPKPVPVPKVKTLPAADAKAEIALEKEKKRKEAERMAEVDARHKRELAEAARREDELRREAEAARAAAQAAEQVRQREADAARLAAQEAEQQRQRQQQARAAALDIYRSQIMRAVRARLVEPPGIQGNPQAEVKVLQLPSGEVVQAKVTRPSGIPAYDEAVERAVLAASPLPLPADRSQFARDFTIVFRLRE